MDNPGRNFMVQEDEPNQHQYIKFTGGLRTGAITDAGFLTIEQLLVRPKPGRNEYIN